MPVAAIRLPRRLFALALLAFTLVPLLELAVLIALGRGLGLWPTLLLCVATGFLGTWLARWQGLRTLEAARRALEAGRFPAAEVLDGAMLLVGGVLLLAPGLLTDLAGLALLLPPTRRVLSRRLRRRWDARRGVVGGEAVARVVGPDDSPSPAPADVPRRVVGFRRDDEGAWVAVLDCGHGRHVRHEPPWQERPWTQTEAGRASRVGTILGCRRCAGEAG